MFQKSKSLRTIVSSKHQVPSVLGVTLVLGLVVHTKPYFEYEPLWWIVFAAVVIVTNSVMWLASLFPTSLSRWAAKWLEDSDGRAPRYFELCSLGCLWTLFPLVMALVTPFHLEWTIAWGIAAISTDSLMLYEDLVHELGHRHGRAFKPRKGASKTCFVLASAFTKTVHYLMFPSGCVNYVYYYVQHIYNHHIENNSLLDTQSTVGYDRTSFLDFCRFALNQAFSVIIAADVFTYLRKKYPGRSRQSKQLMFGQVTYFLLCAVAVIFYWPLAVALVAGRAATGISTAALAWYWHGLFEPDDVTNNLTNSLTMWLGDLSKGKVEKSYYDLVGDGPLHAEHHENMRLRGEDLYNSHLGRLEEYKAQAALVIPLIAPHQLISYLLSQNFNAIADQLVVKYPDSLEVVRRRSGMSERSGEKTFDRSVSNFAANVLCGPFSPR